MRILSELFQGTHQNKVDTKGRVSVPAAFRRILEQNDPDWQEGQNPQLSILFGWPGKGCLEVYSVAAMNEMLEKVRKLPARSPQREAAARMLASNSQRFQLDDNGRLNLPKNLLELANVAGEAIFAGMVDKFEIWNPEQYEEDTKAKLAWFEANGNLQDPLADLG